MTDFSTDDGSCPPLLEQALASGISIAVAAAVRHSRLLIPVVTAPAGALEPDTHDTCGVGDGLASVTFTANDGRRALLAFSSITQLRAWDADARPLPQWGRQIAATVLAADLDALIVDIAAQHRTALQGSDLQVAAGTS